MGDGFPYYCDAGGLNVFLYELKMRCFQPAGRFTIAEIDNVCPDELSDSIGEDGYFSTIFDFSHIRFNVSDPQWAPQPSKMMEEIRRRVFAKQDDAEDKGFLCIILENHDQPQIADRLIPQQHIVFYSLSMLGRYTSYKHCYRMHH